MILTDDMTLEEYRKAAHYWQKEWGLLDKKHAALHRVFAALQKEKAVLAAQLAKVEELYGKLADLKGKDCRIEMGKWYRITAMGWRELPKDAVPLIGDFFPSSQDVADLANALINAIPLPAAPSANADEASLLQPPSDKSPEPEPSPPSGDLRS